MYNFAMQKLLIIFLALNFANVDQTYSFKTASKSPFVWTCDSECDGKFMCSLRDMVNTTKCIDTDKVCDGVKDCPDGTDESVCHKEPACHIFGKILCHDKKTCAKLCDGNMECSAKEDELGCPFSCPDGQYQCKGEEKCILLKNMCDANKDCRYGDDEYACRPSLPCCSSPCLNGAICQNVNAQDYCCECLPGYTGRNCQTNINDCSSDSCQNGGSCIDLINAFACQCLPGYTGNLCQTDVNECDSNSCLNHAVCTDQINSYTCDCQVGFTDKNCQTNINDCEPNPCQNEALCIDHVNDYSCLCPPGYTDKNCQTNINDCHPNPCQNGGTCTDQVNGYTCQCQLGSAGLNCQLFVNVCCPSPCQNGGSCIELENGYECQCLTGYGGENCQVLTLTNINDCHPNPCKNGGTCTDQVNGYTCECPPGYEGHKCLKNINDYCSNPCQNASDTCIDLVNDYVCLSQLVGQNRELLTNGPRSEEICLKGGVCYYEGGYHCICRETCIQPTCQSGSILSLNYPCPYENSFFATWLITVSPGDKVLITFDAFRVENEISCSFDYVEIYDGSSSESPLIARLCGIAIPAPIQTSGNTALVAFSTDSSARLTGFRIVYTPV